MTVTSAELRRLARLVRAAEIRRTAAVDDLGRAVRAAKDAGVSTLALSQATGITRQRLERLAR